MRAELHIGKWLRLERIMLQTIDETHRTRLHPTEG
jgi:hypothetical protein